MVIAGVQLPCEMYISTDRWGHKYDHGMLKLKWKARLRCNKRMPKMDTDLLLTDVDIKEHFETTLE